MTIWPSVADERAIALASILPKSIAKPVPWKTSGILVGIAFLFLTILGAGMFAALFQGSFVIGIMCIIAAEVLIQRFRFFGTGIEAGLWVVALAVFIFQLPHTGSKEGILVAALAAAIVGLRMRSAFFGAIASILVIAYTADKWDAAWPSVIAALSIATLCVLALLIEWERPSNERLFAFIAVVMPLSGYIAAVVSNKATPELPIAGVYAIFGAAALALAIARRDRATLITAMSAIAIAIVEAREVINAPYEAKVIASGALLVIIGAAFSRAFRNKTSGFVVTPSTIAGLDEAIQLAGTISAAHSNPTQTHTEPQRESGGGNFGGAGASGGY